MSVFRAAHAKVRRSARQDLCKDRRHYTREHHSDEIYDILLDLNYFLFDMRVRTVYTFHKDKHKILQLRFRKNYCDVQTKFILSNISTILFILV